MHECKLVKGSIPVGVKLSADKCRTYLSLVASVATPAQLVQMSQVGHKGVVNTVGSCYLNDDITEALETSHLLSLKGGNGSTEVKHLLTP